MPSLPALPAPRPSLGHFRSAMTAAFAFSAVINLLLLSLPLYSLLVFGRAIPSGNLDTLFMLTVVVLGALTIMALLEIVRTKLLSRASTYLDLAFRHRFMEGAIERGRQDALTDLNEVRGFITRPPCTALFDLPWTPVYVLGIYQIHPLLCGIMLAGSGILAATATISHFACRGASDDARIRSARAARMAEGLTRHADTVMALRMQGAAVRHWALENMAAGAASGTVLERGAGFMALAKLARYVLQIAVTGVGAMLVMDNHLSMGGMIATSLLVARAMAPIEQLCGAGAGPWKAVRAWLRLGDHLRAVTARQAAVPLRAGSGHLQANGLLPRLDMVLLPGEALCVFGPNRSGKTLLAKFLTGALRSTAGRALIDGMDVVDWRPADPTEAIGYMPQQVDFIPGTVGQNIARFLPDRDAETLEAATLAGIHDLLRVLPQGYDTDIADPALTPATLRLVALARALFGKPSLLVLDEPAVLLDVPSTESLKRCLAEMKRRKVTLVILSYNSNLLEFADKVMVLNNGAVAAYGPTDHVIGPAQRRPTQVPSEARA